ncbi:hypothetical protein [Yoonia litorea]|uniref:Uncharacterized protein n=1 Tax=Yoonia litorea TaxID=1123755 RepID=A0A1I6MBJ3_9RHOB|nr:hypothetical protein [Yoonia litorea]SFS13041.1 hypothetical protein SAMN05444714_1489 [Yoonia litorea]
MTRIFKLAMVASVALLPALAEAQGNGNGRGNGNGNGNARADNPLNCPPGLAKRQPACVPPGLARQGVTTQQYLDLSDEEWEQATTENPDLLEGNDQDLAAEDGVTGPLTAEEIADLFGIDVPDEGRTYGVIDGQVVELGTEDKLIFDQVKLLSQSVEPGNDIGVVPDVGLTEEQLVAIYNLPPSPDGSSYAVIDGQIYAVPEATYGLLEVIKLAAAFR